MDKKISSRRLREEIFCAEKTTHWGVVTGRRLLPETLEKKTEMDEK